MSMMEGREAPMIFFMMMASVDELLQLLEVARLKLNPQKVQLIKSEVTSLDA